MANSCGDCKQLEEVCGCSDQCYCGGILICNGRNAVSNLKQFPFKATKCSKFERKKQTK